METLEGRTRVNGVPNELLGRAALLVAASYNKDLFARVAEELDRGGDALLMLGRAHGEADKLAIDIAKAWRVYGEYPPAQAGNR